MQQNQTATPHEPAPTHAGGATVPYPHRLYEDAIALVMGTALVALGVTFYTEALLVTGSTAGLALLVQYATGIGFGWVFFAINLPFYVLAYLQMGKAFTIKTFLAVGLVSLFTTYAGSFVDIGYVHPFYAALIGGGLIGVGMLILFRHRASLGGINILALFLQERFGLRAGYFQLGVDALILAGGLLVVPYDRILLSLLGAVVINLVLALNHRPGRYIGVS